MLYKRKLHLKELPDLHWLVCFNQSKMCPDWSGPIKSISRQHTLIGSWTNQPVTCEPISQFWLIGSQLTGNFLDDIKIKKEGAFMNQKLRIFQLLIEPEDTLMKHFETNFKSNFNLDAKIEPKILPTCFPNPKSCQTVSQNAL